MLQEINFSVKLEERRKGKGRMEEKEVYVVKNAAKKTFTEMATELGVSAKAVRNIAIKAGVAHTVPRERERLTEATIDLLWELADKKGKDIAQAMGWSYDKFMWHSTRINLIYGKNYRKWSREILEAVKKDITIQEIERLEKAGKEKGYVADFIYAWLKTKQVTGEEKEWLIEWYKKQLPGKENKKGVYVVTHNKPKQQGLGTSLVRIGHLLEVPTRYQKGKLRREEREYLMSSSDTITQKAQNLNVSLSTVWRVLDREKRKGE